MLDINYAAYCLYISLKAAQASKVAITWIQAAGVCNVILLLTGYSLYHRYCIHTEVSYYRVFSTLISFQDIIAQPIRRLM